MGWLDANFLTMLNGLALAALLFLIAVGLSLVFGTMDVLNLAHGVVSLTGAYIGVALLDPGTGTSGFLVAMLAAAAIGLVLGAVLAAVTSGVSDHLRQALLTLGIAMIAGDVLSKVFGSDVQSVPPPAFLGGSVEILGRSYPTYRLAVIVLSLIIGAVLVGQVQTLGVSLLPDLASFLLFGAMAIVLLLKPAGLLPARYGTGARA